MDVGLPGLEVWGLRTALCCGEAEVDAALGTVIDPELDEPITDLGFVTQRTVTSGDVAVRLRLPTAFCSPNFAYLMVSDAHDAVSALDWVHDVQIVLQDHHDADRIDRGVAAGLGFSGTYPDEAAAELDALRRVFRVKAHTAFIERVCTIVVRDTDWEVGGSRSTADSGSACRSARGMDSADAD